MKWYVSCGNVDTFIKLREVGVPVEFGAENYHKKARDSQVRPDILDNGFLAYLKKGKRKLDAEKYYGLVEEISKLDGGDGPLIGVVMDDWLPESGGPRKMDGVRWIWPVTNIDALNEADRLMEFDDIIGVPVRIADDRGYSAFGAYVRRANKLKRLVHILGFRFNQKCVQWFRDHKKMITSCDSLQFIRQAMHGYSMKKYMKFEHNGKGYGFYPSLLDSAEVVKQWNLEIT